VSGDKKSKKCDKKPHVSVGGEGYKTRLQELLSLVEQEFDQLHSENIARTI